MELRLIRHVVRPRPRFVRKVVLGAIGAALFVNFVVAPRVLRILGESKTEIARITVKNYVTNAYPAWLAMHPTQPCPHELVELDDYMTFRDTKDPWGEHYEMICGHHGFVVYSRGEDGDLGTADDVWSNR